MHINVFNRTSTPTFMKLTRRGADSPIRRSEITIAPSSFCQIPEDDFAIETVIELLPAEGFEHNYDAIVKFLLLKYRELPAKQRHQFLEAAQCNDEKKRSIWRIFRGD